MSRSFRPLSNLRLLPLTLAVAFALQAQQASAEHAPPKTSPEATVVEHSNDVFAADPQYENKPYSDEAELKIYGGKFAVQTPRPLLELGRPIYQSGPLKRSGTAFGLKNPVDQAFSIYGDMRTGFARNDAGDKRTSQVAARLNLEADYKLTATERVHAFFRPLDNNTEFTRCELGSNASGCTGKFDFKTDALFFEGDLAAMMAGATGKEQNFDLAFAAGKMPLLFQNGVWMEDVITGVAATLPAKNSAALGISNMDVTFFGGTDASSGGVRNNVGEVQFKKSSVYGVTTFIEANEGYWELGYAYTDAPAGLADRSYHNLGMAFTRRYGGWLSNSVRVVHNFGQKLDSGAAPTAAGTLLLIENSLVTSLPSTLVPYLNVFYGSDHPQSVSRAVDAGGILKNVGINFETDGLTGFPKLTDNANNMWGGALGLEYLFSLNQQLVFEVATTQPMGLASNRTLVGSEVAFGARYQRPLDKAWIFRADAMMANRSNNTDIAGIRFELRRKF